MSALHGGCIYEGFDYLSHPYDPAGWGGTSPVFSLLITEHKPSFIIEVGSWKGSSAITMANLLAEQGGGTILCVDTWLGAIEFWENQADLDRFQALRCQHGYPQVYYTFLANVCHAKHQETIVPFPIHSSSAALWLLRHGLVADMVYIDASHEEEDVYQDLADYFQLLKPGGILFGDDWNWPGVQSAVKRFASESRLRISPSYDKWIIQKP
jgi:predicted O-methyltransferase YrrM